jgi:hypothetical protein
MKPDELSTTVLAGLPKFQQLQYQFAAHLRDPQNVPYDNAAVRDEAPIESRRIEVYESLLFNNLSSFLGSLFPMMKGLLGESAWQALIRDFMRLHRAQTPLFHELGEEFLIFLQETEQAGVRQLPWLFELAHFEWVELALSIDTAEGFTEQATCLFDIDKAYELSPLAWPLAYQWPVNRMTSALRQYEKTSQATMLLAYRNSLKVHEPVEWLGLTPALYHFLQAIRQPNMKPITLRDWLQVQLGMESPPEEAQQQAARALQPLLDLRLLRAI